MLLRELISQRLGIQVRIQDVDRLQRTLIQRCEHLQLSDLTRYAAFLQIASPASESEWERLACLLTTGETFFFRGKAHTASLRNEILPELIQRRRQQRSLRIWSAGCSSGEEAYSIAIMLDELLAGRNDWSVSVLATDIDVDALSKARRGIYTDWSFRQVDPTIRNKYFHSVGNEWELDQRIKKMATFERLNILTDAFPSPLVREMDLIICRNVFIYFSSEDVGSVVTKFAATLRDGGFLLAGHSELQGQDTNPLVRRVFSESTVLQRDDSQRRADSSDKPFASGRRISKSAEQNSRALVSVNRVEAKTPSANQVLSTEPELEDGSIEQIEQLFKRGCHAMGLERAVQLVKQDPADARVHCLIAQCHADLGKHKEAIGWCEKAIAIDSFAARPQYLLANIAEAEGRYEDAKAHLRKVIYLDPSHVMALLALAGLYVREGDLRLARKTHLAVAEILKSKPDSSLIECHEPLTVGELAHQINGAVWDG